MNKGNLNAVKHSYRSYLRKRVVPKKHRGILRLGDDCLQKIKSDLPDMTGKEELVAEGVRILWSAGLLGLAEAHEHGFIVKKLNGEWDFQEGLKAAGGFIDKAIK